MTVLLRNIAHYFETLPSPTDHVVSRRPHMLVLRGPGLHVTQVACCLCNSYTFLTPFLEIFLNNKILIKFTIKVKVIDYLLSELHVTLLACVTLTRFLHNILRYLELISNFLTLFQPEFQEFNVKNITVTWILRWDRV